MSKIPSPIAAFTFFAKSHPGDICGSNGLPLTANSIIILGRSQYLKAIRHDNLCEYLDIIRSKHGKLHFIGAVSLQTTLKECCLKWTQFLFVCCFANLERTIIVSEYIGRPLTEKPYHIYDDILRIFYQIACGLEHIEAHNFTVQTLEPKNVLVDELGNVKLFNYGMFHQTDRGDLVTFPIGFVVFPRFSGLIEILCEMMNFNHFQITVISDTRHPNGCSAPKTIF